MTEVEAAVARAAAEHHAALDLRERLYAGPVALRLSMRELASALDVSRQTVKRLVERGLPYRMNALGDYTFLAGEARAWLERQERVPTPLRRVS